MKIILIRILLASSLPLAAGAGAALVAYHPAAHAAFCGTDQ